MVRRTSRCGFSLASFLRGLSDPAGLKVNGKTYGKLDMIGKGGSSRVYRVITPSNEIYALKRVSLDRTDQETMQVSLGPCSSPNYLTPELILVRNVGLYE
jgi:hypothetical protein